MSSAAPTPQELVMVLAERLRAQTVAHPLATLAAKVATETEHEVPPEPDEA